MNTLPKRRPGDLIIDRYMPNATPEEREEAHANLRRWVAAMAKVALRVAREQEQLKQARIGTSDEAASSL